MSTSCPALLLSAPASGQGKTTVTAGLARYHRNQGRKVRIFKTGPDFLDPMILERASGLPVYQLDLWMVGERDCKTLLYQAAQEADLILIEGVMGLFDGTPSSADLAYLFGVPVLALINAHAMAQTFGALAYGLAHYRPGLPFAGVLANRVAGPGHAELLAESLPLDLRYYGWLPRDGEIALPDRHLGLVQAAEIADLETRLESTAALIAATGLAELPPSVIFPEVNAEPLPPLLKGVRIGIARDTAFAFLYPANLDLLRALGAELAFFSPLRDRELPAVDSVYLPGGYPELHLSALAANSSMRAALHRHHQANKPIYAECGGLLYTLESLADKEGNCAPMLGLLPGHAALQTKLVGLGMQAVELPEGELRGHTFHHSKLDMPLQPLINGRRQRDGKPGEAVYRVGRLTASYLHLYFASNPAATARLFLP
ncbi:MAG: cobyrinate a,c-diamide synthase [Candidatus Competibacteraceae bacterium]|uniref:Cobyrinate a,c-diamide synthase n=1 Tax=Candidatus Contendobacter odensis Run_B_J11 TaxID=1400861 RepID=A0A7U7J2X6_9GAMM|nr:cobyrinate a,c-diamide synthase [Candidatus Contendobacter odensis]MBK8535614.1 cobyrinate a,c-diamide synthase [Candidatus Competibacteraceae bacterium]MBK8755315.1 cobyrinate a,c-diamide synthase [Candidatus Competibacteraceae bacterium]CDH43947.1 Cobyrinic acid A,C-diamide synthase [Candidatus Contendobacter odensis Run_B_J11]